MRVNFFRRFLALATLAAVMLMQSCNDDTKPVVPVGAVGFFVVNEGGYGNEDTSISFYDRKADAVTNNVFAAKNGRPLGDQTQSMTIFEGKGYVVVQNSGKIEVINVDDFSSVATINDDLASPRYFLGISTSKAYVSDWGADGLTGTVKVVNLQNNMVTKTISTGRGANRMLKIGNLVYVTNAGGYGKDNTIKVIDTSTDEVVNTITTADDPNSIQRDKDGNIWVAAGGSLAYNPDYSIDEAHSTKGAISKISGNAEVLRLPVDAFTFSTVGDLNISPDGTTLYYTYNGAVYSLSTSATALSTTPVVDKDFYGLAIDPTNGNIIGCEAPNFSSAGNIDIYSASGTFLEEFTVGIAPNGCAFK